MFDLGWGELVLIGVVALIAIGPKELPTVMRSVGHWMGKVRRMANEFQGQFQEALREAELSDLKKQADDLKTAVTDATSFDPLADIDNDGGMAEPAKPEPPQIEAPPETEAASEAAPETTAEKSLPETTTPTSESEPAPADVPSEAAPKAASKTAPKKAPKAAPKKARGKT
jgi:sec-independent protein translocase protein TatB